MAEFHSPFLLLSKSIMQQRMHVHHAMRYA